MAVKIGGGNIPLGTPELTLWQDTVDDDVLVVSNSDYDIYYLSKTSHVAAVPEPSTMLLLGIGLVGLVRCSRKLRK